jgi:EAL domain-containing protein (putative c-di-GMP-specific phosphodiesterase class I)
MSFPEGETARRVSVSIGIAAYSPTEDIDTKQLLVEADIALYDAKEAGRGSASLFDPHHPRQRTMHASLNWADRIRAALAESRFVAYAQPILPLVAEAGARYELLVRMLSTDGEVIPPAAFLESAERFELVQAIDRSMLHQGIALLGAQQRLGRDVRLAVNLSAKSLADASLAGYIESELSAAAADPARLCLELTETSAIVNVDMARRFAVDLAELGCEVALDDFGSGFASFYYLKHLAYNYIKIDGEFIMDIGTSATSRLVVDAIVNIAHGLGKRTIAESVDRMQTLTLLREIGVDYAQGYQIARPAPATQLAHVA